MYLSSADQRGQQRAVWSGGGQEDERDEREIS